MYKNNVTSKQKTNYIEKMVQCVNAIECATVQSAEIISLIL